MAKKELILRILSITLCVFITIFISFLLPDPYNLLALFNREIILSFFLISFLLGVANGMFQKNIYLRVLGFLYIAAIVWFTSVILLFTFYGWSVMESIP